MRLQSFILSVLLLVMMGLTSTTNAQNKPLSVAVAGLSHDHIYLLMHYYQEGRVNILGIAETDPVLIEKFKKSYHLADSLFYKDLPSLLSRHRPEIVMAFGPNNEHLKVVKDCAPFSVNVMVEKPLATTVEDAQHIEALARRHQIKVLTNYETTWYGSNQSIYDQVRKDQLGAVTKMVVHDGHQGPKEIGCSPQFLSWLTDPEKNGAGALFDFGCYGANLMTWLMNGQLPTAVYATTRQIKPDIYPNVDDDATIVLDYPSATGIIEASWNWPFNIKDWEVYGKTGYMQAVDPNTVRTKNHKDRDYTVQRLSDEAAPFADYVDYVTQVVRGQIDPGNDLSSLANNLIVVKILAAARTSARTGKKVYLK